MTSKEITGKFQYATTAGTKTFTGVSTTVTKAECIGAMRNYAGIVDGTLKDEGKYKEVEVINYGE